MYAKFPERILLQLREASGKTLTLAEKGFIRSLGGEEMAEKACGRGVDDG